ncbi:hypothetical protein O181_073623 [Austropuccinia psidii MF-1]|uniref:Uncharacterized protein n=1 Tax=Austropuccinia psidii MF-1 TaxID=1389203 RepID=A0A9Q3F9G4_9BASI|nr:hypothetical protein [Austropuccinia psidii MF-1]
MGPGHMGGEVGHGHFNGPMDPMESQPMGQLWPWGTPITPMDHRTCKRPKDPKGPKKTKKALNPNMIKNGHSDGQDPKQSRWSKMAKLIFKPSSRTMGTGPLLELCQRSIKMRRTKEDQLSGQ